MNANDLVQSWKQLGTRSGTAVDHPAGEIRLRAGGGLGRRSGLLGAHQSVGLSHDPWPTVSITVVPDEERR
ncbi:hypothetical protein [Streptomyces sp. NBC_01233]|uniref:hypothetical protein n=1 Tax=Streptomyces sp. NBC_01233 TaxID=2903787 RepID=UPI002E1509C2|nr:hypothetical protein OG332_05380 [Streptomyces sp. NBC_01233]